MFEKSKDLDAKDNVVATSCKILMHYPTAVPFDQMYDFINRNVPLTGDPEENETVITLYMQLIESQPQKVESQLEKVVMICLKVLVDEKCSDISKDFKAKVGKFIKEKLMAHPTALQILQQTESQMSEEEKKALA